MRFDVPIDDGSAPEGTVVEKFWYAATEMYEVGSYPETSAQETFLEQSLP